MLKFGQYYFDIIRQAHLEYSYRVDLFCPDNLAFELCWNNSTSVIFYLWNPFYQLNRELYLQDKDFIVIQVQTCTTKYQTFHLIDN